SATKLPAPGSSGFMPCARERIRHLGGKMLDTRTRLQAAMPAERSASSNDVSFSRCLPTPFVKNISLGTNPTTSRSFVAGKVHGKQARLNLQVTIDVRRARSRVRAPRHQLSSPALPTPRARGKLGELTISPPNMNRVQARESARELLEIVPLVMRTLAA